MMTERITSGQRDQLAGFATAVTRKVVDAFNPDKDGAQLVIENGDEFSQIIGDAVRLALVRLSVSQEYASEEVVSSYGYLSGFRAPKSLVEQVVRLHQLFPEELGTATANESLTAKRADAEGPAAIPRWQKLAPTYGEAVEKVLDKLNEVLGGKFYNYRKGQLGPEFLRESVKKATAFQKFGEEQIGHDILVVNVQLGLRHRGRSVRRARAMMNGYEFGLGAYEVAILLLLNPNRLAHFNDLWIDCAGDEYCPGADGRPARAPVFDFVGGGLGFNALFVGDARDDYGSASGFSSVPQ